MIIKKIILENIRSYEYTEMEFNEGSTLLTGNIGAGKTSILLGIEFGLFGLQPGQRGSVLLRNKTDEGSVKLLFEVDGKDVLIERTLKRGKTVSQDYVAITTDGQKEEFSVTEAKSRVLDILNYPAELSKKQNTLYRFTAYTPQEEMKQIIQEDPETRLNILRYVFGVDKYKKVLENTGALKSKLAEEKKMMTGITFGLDADKKKLETKINELDEKKELIFNLESDLLLKIEKRKDKEKEKLEVQKLIDGKSDLKIKLGQTKGLLHSKTEIFANNEKTISSLKKEIEEFKLLNFNEYELQEIEEEILKKQKAKEKLTAMNLEINSKSASLSAKLIEAKKLEKKLQSLESCPTCHQNIDAVYRANVLNQNHNEIHQSKNQIEELEIEKKNIFNKIRETEISINLYDKKLTGLKIMKMKLEGIKEREIKLKEIEKRNYSFEADIHMLKEQIGTLKEDLLKLSKYDHIFEEKSIEFSLLLKDERVADIKLAEARKEIEIREKVINELKIRINEIESVKTKLDQTTEKEQWLNRKFIPLVADIERRAMISLKHEFSKLFSNLFSILVPENFSVSLSDNFTPIIEQGDSEINYAYLSGGEKTAVALAYRLALTHAINSISSKIKTKNLIILDEPTDGFSNEQLDKMREVLGKLKVKQLIMVSHEQKIEGFVENVIKLRKDCGISRKN